MNDLLLIAGVVMRTVYTMPCTERTQLILWPGLSATGGCLGKIDSVPEVSVGN